MNIKRQIPFQSASKTKTSNGCWTRRREAQEKEGNEGLGSPPLEKTWAKSGKLFRAPNTLIIVAI
jgi:hypothetical protein